MQRSLWVHPLVRTCWCDRPDYRLRIMGEQLVTVDGIELCLSTVGSPADPALLLIAGVAMSMDWWAVEFCEQLAAGGRFVIRYDHRDTGRSASWPPGAPDYTGDDLAADPLRVLDAVGVPSAHLVGVSMGGGIAQQIAAVHPERVRSLTLIATSPAGERRLTDELPGPETRLLDRWANPVQEPDWSDSPAVVDYLVEDFRLYAGSLGFDEDVTRRTAAVVVARTRDIHASTVNHAAAEAGSSSFSMSDITAPTMVLHGTADPMVGYPHGQALAAEIAGARLIRLPGMGHEVPPPALWPVVVPAILAHTAD